MFSDLTCEIVVCFIDWIVMIIAVQANYINKFF